jgi:hypothetical protein
MLPSEIKGVSTKDINKLEDPESVIKQISALGANSIRLPIYQLDVKILENIISIASSYGLTSIIDNHQICDINNQTLEYSLDFWNTIVDKFSNSTAVFELFNEPVNVSDTFDVKPAICWDSYFAPMNKLAKHVRDKCDNLLLVGTPAMCGVLSPSVVRPIEISNMAYTAHVYPPEIDSQMFAIQKLKKLYDFKMSVFDHIYKCSSQHEIVITEFGWSGNPDPRFIKQLYSNLSCHGHVAWVYDHEWRPPMLDADSNLNGFGRSVKELYETGNTL